MVCSECAKNRQRRRERQRQQIAASALRPTRDVRVEEPAASEADLNEHERQDNE